MTNTRISQSHTCLQCGKTFFPFRASKGFYCSNKCRFVASEKNPTYTCEGCGKTFIDKRHRAKYCSNPCYQKKKINRTLTERLFPFIEKTDYCWLWNGSRVRGGYGRIYFNGKFEFVHRLMYEAVTGEDISNKVVRHYICDNPPCCNPEHLRSGTMADNSADAVRHKRHAHGETSYAKLTESDVLKIRADNRKQEEIANQYGVSRGCIKHIKLRNTWKHLP